MGKGKDLDEVQKDVREQLIDQQNIKIAQQGDEATWKER